MHVQTLACFQIMSEPNLVMFGSLYHQMQIKLYFWGQPNKFDWCIILKQIIQIELFQ